MQFVKKEWFYILIVMMFCIALGATPKKESISNPQCDCKECDKCKIMDIHKKIESSFAEGDFAYPINSFITGGSIYFETGGPLLKIDSQESRDYIINILNTNYEKVIMIVDSIEIQMIANGDVAIVTNNTKENCFMKNGGKRDVYYRSTFVMLKTDNQWKIFHMHLSLVNNDKIKD